MMTVFSQANNPIHRRELIHQQRGLSSWMRHENKIALAVLVVLFVVAAMPMTPTVGRPYFLPFPPQLWIVWAIHILVAVRGIIAGSSAMSREYAESNWDSLILTGISARQIILGKWRAVLNRMWGWGIALAVSWVGITFMTILDFSRYARGPNRSTGNFQIDVVWVLVAVAVAVGLSFLEILSSTALGIAGSILTRRTATAALAASTIRFLPLIFLIFSVFRRSRRSFQVGTLLFSLADGGTSATMNLMMFGPFRQLTAQSLIAATLLVVGLLAASLVIGLKVMRWHGALPHPAQRG